MTRAGADERDPPTPPGGQADADGGDAAQAAEELAGRVAGWVAGAVAHAREEAEDVWAEAQDLRRRW
jgi:hypothetical protein